MRPHDMTRDGLPATAAKQFSPAPAPAPAQPRPRPRRAVEIRHHNINSLEVRGSGSHPNGAAPSPAACWLATTDAFSLPQGHEPQPQARIPRQVEDPWIPLGGTIDSVGNEYEYDTAPKPHVPTTRRITR